MVQFFWPTLYNDRPNNNSYTFNYRRVEVCMGMGMRIVLMRVAKAYFIGEK